MSISMASVGEAQDGNCAFVPGYLHLHQDERYPYWSYSFACVISNFNQFLNLDYNVRDCLC